MEIGFPKFGRACVFFALFFVFCRFENPAGILYPVGILGLEAAYLFFMKKTGASIKKDSYFYLAAAALLSISTCLTDNWVIQYFNRIGIWLLFGVTCLHNSYEDEKWRFSTYIRNLFALFFTILGNSFVIFRYRKTDPKQRDKEKTTRYLQILLGVLIALFLLTIILPMLARADVVFKSLLEKLFGNLFQGMLFPARLAKLLFLFAVAVLLSFSSGYSLRKKGLKEDQKDHRGISPVVAITFTSILAFVYLFFCGLQITVLLGGARLPEGYTYSAYAREGFFQLLFVSMLNLALVLACIAFFRENKILRLLLTVISACTYFLTGSAFYRIMLYIEAYGLTRLRVLTVSALLAIAVLLIGILANIYDYEFPLFRFSVAVVTCVYVVLSLSRMDAWIAEYNLKTQGLAAMERNQYVFQLSADAAGSIERAATKEPEQSKLIQGLVTDYFDRMAYYEEDFRTFNVSHHLAKQAAFRYFSRNLR